MSGNDTILFFDGVCGLCNGLVDWLLPRDKREQIKYATLQGAKARELLPQELLNDLNTVAVWHAGKIYTRSDAIILCLSKIGGLFKLAVLCKIIPRAVRDAIYNFIARRRYRWFGKRHTCRMPLPGERMRFLD